MKMDSGDNISTITFKDEKDMMKQLNQPYFRKRFVFLKNAIIVIALEIGILLLASVLSRLKILSSEFLISDEESFAILFALSTFIILSFIVLSFRRIQELKKQVKKDRQIVAALVNLQGDLERKVSERTSDLANMNELLQ
jgi:hypothetical protein